MAPKPQQKRAKGAVLLGTYTEPKARMAERGWAMGDLGGTHLRAFPRGPAALAASDLGGDPRQQQLLLRL